MRSTWRITAGVGGFSLSLFVLLTGCAGQERVFQSAPDVGRALPEPDRVVVVSDGDEVTCVRVPLEPPVVPRQGAPLGRCFRPAGAAVHNELVRLHDNSGAILSWSAGAVAQVDLVDPAPAIATDADEEVAESPVPMLQTADWISPTQATSSPGTEFRGQRVHVLFGESAPSPDGCWPGTVCPSPPGALRAATQRVTYCREPNQPMIRIELILCPP